MPDSSLSGGDMALVAVVLVISLAALGFAAYLVKAVMAADQGTVKMREIAQAVQEGAAAYLRRQFRTLGVFAVIVFLLLLVLPVAEGGWETRIGRAVFFLVGAFFSASVGFIGMTLATRGNVRVAAAARGGGYLPAFRIAYRTGGVVGMITIGLGLFGSALALLLFDDTAPIVLEGFGFGGALLAMFMRVGGGIFTKAADVGADLVGKVEAGIPEDDPRNAATIADNVGDNVGDCAGMAADLFESYAVTLVAALILGQVFFGNVGMVFPLLVAAIGVIASVVGVLATRPEQERLQRHGPDQPRLLRLRRGLPRAGRRGVVHLPAQHRRRGRPVGQPAGPRLPLGARRRRPRGGHPAAHRLLHRDQPQAGQGHRPQLADRPGDGDPLRHLPRPGVRRLRRAAHRRRRLRRLPHRRRRRALRRRAGRLRPADHGRRHRRHGHVRPGQRQRAGHRRDVRRHRRGGRPGAHRPRRRRQHDQGDHQGHRDRDGRARRDRALRVVQRAGRAWHWTRPARPSATPSAW